ncbi:hypothetical protein AB0G71_29320 [Streptomyces sp. NPDC020403]|uniref:hypothetical protein n=1 Tax=unclassified Streptomyces TaxID=2593676 RepID=UPI0033E70654
MGSRTTEEVYDKVVVVEGKVDGIAATALTTKHFDEQVKTLKTAIEKGPKKEEEQTWKDIVKETSPVKEFLAVFKGSDLLAKVLLAAAAATAAAGLLAGLLVKAKQMTIAYTGRTRTMGTFGAVRPQDEINPRYFGRGQQGGWRGWGMQPAETPLAQGEGAGQGSVQAQRPNLTSATQIDEVKTAMVRLNAEIDTYRGKVRGLATPSAMRQMASAAKKLENAAKKHQTIDTLATSIGALNREMRTLAGTAS